MHRDPTRHQRADANSRPDGDGARQNVTHDVRVCVSVCCVRACVTVHHTRYRPPSTSSPPLLPPLRAAAETRESSKGRGGRWRDETCDRRNGNSCFRAIRFHARRRLSIRSPIFFPREFSPAFLPSSLSAVADGIYIVWKIRRLVSFDSAWKKRGRERSVVSMRNRRILCFDEQEGEGRKIDNVCFSNFLKFFPFAKKKKKKGNSSRKSSKNSLFLSIRD